MIVNKLIGLCILCLFLHMGQMSRYTALRIVESLSHMGQYPQQQHYLSAADENWVTHF